MEHITVNTRTKGRNSQPFSYPAIGKLETSEVEVDGIKRTVETVNSAGVLESFAQATELFSALNPENVERRMLDILASGYNREQRNAASPAPETVTTDELTSIVEALVAGNFLQAEHVGNWRRTVTSSAKLMEKTRLEIADMTKEVKAAKKAGIL